jgi:tetratricopeptide (TPR) repeat protein
LYQQSLELERKRSWETPIPHVAQSLNNLALLYDSTGRYSEANFVYQQSLELRNAHWETTIRCLAKA